jgi:hypothetical protein
MARYFFNTEDGVLYADEDGVELPDLDAARSQAARIMGELLKEKPAELFDTGHLRVEVIDQTGAIVLILETQLTCEATS